MNLAVIRRKAARIFSPQARALGLGIDEELSPSLLERVTFLGTKLPSFRDAFEAANKLLRVKIGEKRVERITERIGTERVIQREADIAGWSELKLTEKLAAPPGVKGPKVASLMADGGRLQLREADADAKSHWHEYKAGLLQCLSSEVSSSDPHPQIPEFFLQPERMDKLAREITRVAARVESLIDKSDPDELSHSEISAMMLGPEEERSSTDYQPPKVIDRDIVASRRDSQTFGRHLAAAAWSLGFFAAERKAFVGDGQNWIWTEWERHFKPHGFVPILDFIHALTHVYAAAMAGRPIENGWPVYVRWITAVWQGNVTSVIAELAVRQQELGLPTDEDGDTSPRTLVTKTLTYLQNQQSRMNYPEYRRLGLPMTSAHMESTVKQLNRRLKGTEKFWSDDGSEALLQLVGDELSTSQPMTEFWRKRSENQTGYRTYTKYVT
jgi:hypothetical protein